MLLRAVGILALVFAVEARARIEIDHVFSGRLNAESRWFPEAGAHAGQRSHASGFVAEPRLYLEDAAGRSLTLAPFFRYDNTDPRRTHADLREAYLLLFGEIGDGEWELRAGVDQVFWGVTESQHLVDLRSTMFRAAKLSLVCWGMWTGLLAPSLSHWSDALPTSGR